MDFGSIEASFLRVTCSLREITGDLLQLTFGGDPRLADRSVCGFALPVISKRKTSFSSFLRGTQRSAPIRLQRDMGNPAHVPHLQEDSAICFVHGFGHFLPAGYLQLGVNSRSPQITLSLSRDLRRFADNEARA